MSCEIVELTLFQGAKPSARSYFSSMLYQDTIFMYGGRGWVTVDNIDKTDLWSYNITENRWSELEPTGIIPLGRQGHTAINFGTTMIVFAGYTEPSLQVFRANAANVVLTLCLRNKGLVIEMMYGGLILTSELYWQIINFWRMLEAGAYSRMT